MDEQTLNRIFANIPADWKQLLAGQLRTELVFALSLLAKIAQSTPRTIDMLCPPADLIFNFARITPLDSVNVVLLGQDPYIGEGEAVGLSFSCPIKIPPSLRNIYGNLLRQGLIQTTPSTGDLTHWAQQGILLLNSALTTIRGKSREHKHVWETYTDALIVALARMKPDLIFILLGNDAIDKQALIPQAKCLTWGHPSPLSSFNRSESNPKHFVHCTAFKAADEALTVRGIRIDWMPVGTPNANDASAGMIVSAKNVNTVFMNTYAQHPGYDCSSVVCAQNNTPVPTLDTVYVFTDGGCTGNGEETARASYAFAIMAADRVYTFAAYVPMAELGGKYQTSNNRGELTAISHALDYIRKHTNSFTGNMKIQVISDSKYSIGCYTQWAYSWISDPKKAVGKKNLDIIFPTIATIQNLKQLCTIYWKHVNSHQIVIPSDPLDRFYWIGNDIVDKMCQEVLTHDRSAN